jgi:tRNA threonylcarbamoyladenosine biosynthesis protein TsaB
MNLLAFDTSTESMSVAVQRGTSGELWQHSGPGGAQTSTQLIPTIEVLMAQAGLGYSELDAIVFGCGPGSFTGLRTACSVAQGLAFGAGIPVLPIDTLLCVAEEARLLHAPQQDNWQVLALLDARMDELYAACYAFDNGVWRQTRDYRLLHPEAVQGDAVDAIIGNVFAAYGLRLPASTLPRIEVLPSASALLRLAPQRLAGGAALAADQALPLYIRDKVAQTTLERAAQKAAL